MKVLRPVKSQSVSPLKFVALVKNHREEIERSEFVPPIIGGKGFGRVVVTYKHPKLIADGHCVA